MEIVIFGESGEKVRLDAADILVMPAGVRHVMVGHSDDVMMAGGYPVDETETTFKKRF